MADAPEQPAFDLLGVRVFARRDGDHVTGHVTFPPYQGGIQGGSPSSPRPSVPIDYHSRRPSTPPPTRAETANTTPPLGKGGTGGSPSDRRAAHRRNEVVDAYLEALRNRGRLSKTKVAANVARIFQVSQRSVQLWVRKFETAGLAGLADRYSANPSRLIICSSAQALDAMRICAWWSFRIGNLACIEHRATHAALDLLVRGFAVADILATIDRYFSYSCDRTRMPFKAFSKWVRYDFEKWLHRACADAEYLREVTESRGRGPVPLQAPETRQPPRLPGVRTRRRLANNRATRAGIARLGPAAEVIRDRDTRLAHRSAVPTPPLTKGGTGGCPSPPSTVTEAIQNLDDGYRVMLWRAAKRDRQARKEAIATLPLWWSTMPGAVHHNIEAQTEAWSEGHPGASAALLAGRKVDMLLAALRRDRVGPQRLHVARALTG